MIWWIAFVLILYDPLFTSWILFWEFIVLAKAGFPKGIWTSENLEPQFSTQLKLKVGVLHTQPSIDVGFYAQSIDHVTRTMAATKRLGKVSFSLLYLNISQKYDCYLLQVCVKGWKIRSLRCMCSWIMSIPCFWVNHTLSNLFQSSFNSFYQQNIFFGLTPVSWLITNHMLLQCSLFASIPQLTPVIVANDCCQYMP